MGQHILALVNNDIRLIVYRMLHKELYSKVQIQFGSHFVVWWDDIKCCYNLRYGWDLCARQLHNPLFHANNYFVHMFWVSRTTNPTHGVVMHDLPKRYQYSSGTKYSDYIK